MIASRHFFCSQFLECLSIGCWITWINPLIFWSPLSYCPCVYLFALLSSRFDFSCFHSVDFSCLFLLFFKKLLRYMCGFFALFFFFCHRFLLHGCIMFFYSSEDWGWWAWRAGEQCFSFVCFFPALPILLSFFFFFCCFDFSCWTFSLGIWRSSAICSYLTVKHRNLAENSVDKNLFILYLYYSSEVLGLPWKLSW